MKQPKNAPRAPRHIATVVGCALIGALAVPGAVVFAEGVGATQPAPRAEAGKAPSSGIPYTKNQVVYAKSDATGASTGVYVVNSFEGAPSGTVTDAGAYRSVTNLSDDQDLASEDGRVSFEATEGSDFVYQGDLDASTELPWTVSVSCRLDGRPVEPKDLAGASGHLEMRLAIAPNDACEHGADYTDNYLLQATGLLPAETTHGLSAEGATVAQNGDDLQLTYMILPGGSSDYAIEADVEDFSFDGWQIVGVPLSLALDVDASSMDTTDLVELENGIAALSAGADQVDDGAGQVRGGVVQLRAALAQAESGSSQLADGAGDVADGADALDRGADELASKGGELTAGSAAVSSGIGTAASGADELSGAFSGEGGLVSGSQRLAAGSDAYLSGLQSSLAGLGSTDVASAKASYAAAAGELQQAVQALQEAAASSGDVEGAAARVSQAASGLDAAAQQLAAVSGNAGAAGALSGAIDGYGDVDAGIDSLAAGIEQAGQGAVQLSSGLSTLDGQYAALDGGIRSYAAGAGALSQGAGDLASGARALAAGAGAIDEGAQALSAGSGTLEAGASELAAGTGDLAAGASELASRTIGLDDQVVDAVREQIEGMLDPQFALRDFANGSTDEHLGRVQFVYVTGAITQE